MTRRAAARDGERVEGALPDRRGGAAPDRAGGASRARKAGAAPVRADLSLRTVGRVLAGIPSFGRLLFRLMRDGRVSPFDRALFGFTLAYLLWPVDLVPDWLPFLGQADDLVLLTLALGRLLYRTDEAVLLEHWEGEEESFLLLEDLLDRLSSALPWWARRLLRAGG